MNAILAETILAAARFQGLIARMPDPTSETAARAISELIASELFAICLAAGGFSLGRTPGGHRNGKKGTDALLSIRRPSCFGEHRMGSDSRGAPWGASGCTGSPRSRRRTGRRRKGSSGAWRRGQERAGARRSGENGPGWQWRRNGRRDAPWLRERRSGAEKSARECARRNPSQSI